jgi:hypothetical protein
MLARYRIDIRDGHRDFRRAVHYGSCAADTGKKPRSSIACVALVAFVVFRIVGFMERHDSGHHGIVLGLPLLCIGFGMMVNMAWMEANGKAVGPWRLIIALAFLLGTIVVAVLF